MSFAITAAVVGVISWQTAAFLVVTIASSLYQQRQAKQAANKAKSAAAEAANASKGFQVVSETPSASLPLVYGRALVGGIRVYADTQDTVKVLTGPGQNFTKGLDGKAPRVHTSTSKKGKKRYSPAPTSFLLTQQAVAVSGINRAVTVDVNQTPWDDYSLRHGQYLTFYGEGGIADPIIAVNDKKAFQKTVTGSLTYLNGGAVGNLVAKFPGLSAYPQLTTNPSNRSQARFTGAAYGSGIFKLNRDEPQYQGIPNVQYYVEGMKVRKVERVSGSYLVSKTREYSNNPALCLLDFMLDSTYGRGLDVEDLDLESFYVAARVCDEVVMHNVGKEGRYWANAGFARDIRRYELNCAFDTSAPLRDTIEVMMKSMGDADLIWSAGKFRLNLTYPQVSLPAGGAYVGLVMQAGAGANTHLYRCIKDTYAAPGHHADWVRVDRDITESDLHLDENMVQVWPSAQDRLNHCKVTFLNEALDFTEDTAEWPPKIGTVPGPRIDRGPWTANNEYNTSDIVSFSGKSYQLLRGVKYKSSKSPNADPTWVSAYSNTVYQTYLAQDSGIKLEASEQLAFTTDYYHALAYAENRVRLSRERSAFTVGMTLDHWELEPGDYLSMTAPSIGLLGELCQVKRVEFVDQGFLRVDMEVYDARHLAWNAKDDEIVLPRVITGYTVGQAVDLDFEPDLNNRLFKVGTLTWAPPPTDGRVNSYRVKATTLPIGLISESTVWEDLGSTVNCSFDIRSIPPGSYTLAVVACTDTSSAPFNNTLIGSRWPLLPVGFGSIDFGNISVYSGQIFKASATAPLTPEGGEFDFKTLSFTTMPSGWGAQPPYGAPVIWRSQSLMQLGMPLLWSEPELVEANGTSVTFSRDVLIVDQDEEGVNIGYDNATTRVTVLLNYVDVTLAASTTIELFDLVNCTMEMDTGANKGRLRVLELIGDRGSAKVRIKFAGITFIQNLTVMTHLPDPEELPPEALDFLRTTSRIFGIGLNWGFKGDTSRAVATELEFRDVSPDNSLPPIALGSFAFPTDTHSIVGLAAGIAFQFRGRVVDTKGQEGPWSDWVVGESSSDAGEILDYLQGQITASELGIALKADITRIGTIDASLNDEILNRQSAFEGLGAQITQTNSEVATNKAALRVEELARATGDDALSGRITATVAETATVKAQLRTEEIARADADGALSTRITAAQSKANTNSADLRTEETTRANADSALSTRITAAQAKADAAAADLRVEEVTRANEVGALSSRITTAQASALLAADQATDALERLTVSDTRDTNQPPSWYYANHPKRTVLEFKRSAAIGVSATAGLYVNLETRVPWSDASGGAIVQNALVGNGVKNIQRTSVGDSWSAWKVINEEILASVQVNSQAIANVDGTLKAQHTIKVQTSGSGPTAKKVMTGIGLVADGASGESSILMMANRLALLSTLNGVEVAPFIVENGQIFINQAFIKDATIVNAVVNQRLVSGAKDPWGNPLIDINFQTGAFTLRSFIAGQGSTVMNNKGTRVYDAAGNVRVKLGDLS